MKFVKIILIVSCLIVLTGVVLIGSMFIWDKYNHHFWTPDEKILPITTQMTKSDAYFHLGEPKRCSTDSEICIWQKNYSNETFIVTFDPEEEISSVSRISHDWHDLVPYRNVDMLLNTLGPPDILAVSKNYLERRYSYYDWGGVSFTFESNKLRRVTFGEVLWRTLPDMSEYYVNERRICPDIECPFDAEGAVKQQWVGKTLKDFLSTTQQKDLVE